MHKRTISTTTISLVFLIFISSFPVFAGANFGFKKVNMDNGLSYNSALCLHQDRELNIWIGTRDGLNRYNGVDNQIFKQSVKNSYSLSNSHINCIHECADGELWIGTAYGLNVYKGDDIFSSFLPSDSESVGESSSLTNGYIRCISESADGSLWLGTLAGLNHFDRKSKVFSSHIVDEMLPLANNIISLFYDNENRLWVGTASGLYVKSKDEFQAVNISDAVLEVRDIQQGLDGRYWIATEDAGVYHFSFIDGEVNDLVHIDMSNSELNSNSVRKLLIEEEQSWLGTLKGLTMIDKSGHVLNVCSSASNLHSISNSSVHDIVKDHLGGYWLATYSGGANYYHPQNNIFPILPLLENDESGHNDKDVTSIAVDGNNNLWVATNTSGLYYRDVDSETYTHYYHDKYPNLSSDNIKSISLDDDNNLWVASYHGLCFYNQQQDKWHSFLHDPTNSNSLNFDQVHAVLCDKVGQVWVGMNGGEFQLYSPKTREFTTIRGVYKYVEALYEDSKGHLWVGGPGGLKCIDVVSHNFIDISQQTNGLNSQLKNINCITEDKQGRLWIGTKGTGIMVLDNGKFYEFDEKNGLNDNIINMIQEGVDDNMWLSTNQGLTQLRYGRDDDGKATISCIHYSTTEGLQGKQFEKGSGCITKDGFLLFGGINGVNIVDPRLVNKRTYFPDVVVSDFKINKFTLDSESYSFITSSDNTYYLDFKERNISLSFVGIHYVDPGGIFYRYRLNGEDDSWIYLNHQRHLNFIGLSPGEYELDLQASSNNNIWGVSFCRVKVVVKPPLWKTWWAYALYLCLFAVIIFLVLRYYGRMVKLKNSLAMSEYKSDHEKALNESKFRFFTDISHELRTPLTLILGPLEYIIKKEQNLDSDSLRQLNKMQHNGNRMLRLINQVLNLRKIENGYNILRASANNLLDMVDVAFKEFDDIAKEQGVELVCDVQLQESTVWFEPDKLESVLYNLLSNAIKNTPKGEQITLRIAEKSYPKTDYILYDAYVEISVHNVGLGISPEESEQLFTRFYSKHDAVSSTGVGLELTKRIVRLHHGHIWVESALQTDSNKGFAKFYVALPLGNSHLNEDEIVSEHIPSTLPKYMKSDISKTEASSVDDTVETLPKSSSEKLTLLVVEDNFEMRQFIKELLHGTYNIVEADNGSEALKIAKKLRPSLIISDVMMPISDGIELCKAVKKDTRISHIPVILLTARSGSVHQLDGLESGADDYITKPFSADYLRLRVDNLLRQRLLYKKHFSQQALLEPESVSMDTADDKLLKKAVDYISANMSNAQLSVEVLSKEVGLSRVHFYRKIKSLTGLTAVEFIRSIRLKRAASLLEQASLSIKEIQLEVGFDNADYFRKCFKDYYKLTPTEYRQNILLKQVDEEE